MIAPLRPASTVAGEIITAVSLLSIRFPKLKLGNWLMARLRRQESPSCMAQWGSSSRLSARRFTCWLINVAVYGFARNHKEE